MQHDMRDRGSTAGPWHVPIACCLLAACAGQAGEAPYELRVAGSSVIISTESELLAMPNDVALDEDGRLYVLDRLLGRIVAASDDGAQLEVYGREGAGPGEFRAPRALAVDGDTIRVADMGNARMQLLSRSGEYLGIGPLPGKARGGPFSLRRDGWTVVGTRGTTDSLAMYFDEKAEQRGSLGAPVAPIAGLWSFPAMKEQIADGLVPEVFRNVVLPAFSEDGFWLVFEAEGIVRKYDASGALAWTLQVQDPVLDAIKERFFEANRNEPNPRRLHTLSYFTDALEIDGRLWLLLEVPEEDPTVLLILTAQGTVQRRLVFSDIPGARAFAVDGTGATVYFTVPSLAAVLAAPIPTGT